MCLLRVAADSAMHTFGQLATCVGLLSRLDMCMMPRGFEFYDPGHRTYVGFLLLDYYYSNPVFLCAAECLLDGKCGTGIPYGASAAERRRLLRLCAHGSSSIKGIAPYRSFAAHPLPLATSQARGEQCIH